MDDAHEGSGIALGENSLALIDIGNAEIAGYGKEIARQQRVEQAAIQQHVAYGVVQVGQWF